MKKMHRKTMRGTVLFTTVAVMALMIIFLMGTLMLASASNSRAHKSYSVSQASYTARTAVESFTTAMQREGGIAAAVQELSQAGTNSKKLVNIQMNDPSLGKVGYIDDNGVFHEGQILVENIGGDEYEYIADDGQSVAKTDSGASSAKWVKLDRVKITATCQVGKEEETVSAYIVKKNGSSTQSGGGTTSVKGIQMVGNAGLPNGKNVTGGFGVNLSSLSDAKDVVTKVRNNMNIETSLSFINSSLVWNSSSTKISIKEPPAENAYTPYSATVINGNLYVGNNEFVELDYDGDVGWSNKEIPYVYVDGAVVNGSQFIIKNVGSKKPMFNMIVGTFITNGEFLNFANTNLYMMDNYDASSTYTIYKDTEVSQEQYENINNPNAIKGKDAVDNYRNNALGKSFRKGDNYLGYSGTSVLSAWAESLASGSDANIGIGGSVFCNGNLHLKQITINGDVRVEGDCEIDNSVTINGNLYVGGTITGSGANSIPASKKFSAHPVTDERAAEFQAVNNIPKAGASEKDQYQIVERTANYLKWDSSMHKRTLDDEAHSIVDVDMWGNVLEQPTIIYYRWKDEVDITEDRLSKAAIINENISYNDLEANIAFSEFRDDVYFMKYLDITVEQNESQENLVADKDEAGNYYYQAVPVANDGQIIASGKKSDTTYYEHKENHNVISQADYDNLGSTVEGYWRAKMDGTSSGQDAGMNPVTYYIDNNASRWTYSYDEASTAKVVFATTESTLPNHMTALYPTEMKRENIYGTHGTIGEDGTDFTPASNQTKIITTLNEARTALGLKANGEIDTDKYPTSFPDAENYPVAIDGSTVYDATADNLFNSTVDGNKAISKNCIIKGQPNQDIYVKTEGKTIYILLDNVKLDCHKIVVDHVVDSNGAIADGDVVFIIKGTLDVINNGSGIVTKEFINLPGYDYTKDWGIIYYAENSGSTKPVITVKNGEGTMVGCFRTPTAIFAQFGNGGFWEKEYTGEDGQTVKDKPVIVGNALFDKVYGQNNIINHYTATGGGGGSSSSGMKTIVTDVGFFEIQYMLGG